MIGLYFLIIVITILSASKYVKRNYKDNIHKIKVNNCYYVLSQNHNSVREGWFYYSDKSVVTFIPFSYLLKDCAVYFTDGTKQNFLSIPLKNSKDEMIRFKKISFEKFGELCQKYKVETFKEI